MKWEILNADIKIYFSCRTFLFFYLRCLLLNEKKQLRLNKIDKCLHRRRQKTFLCFSMVGFILWVDIFFSRKMGLSCLSHPLLGCIPQRCWGFLLCCCGHDELLSADSAYVAVEKWVSLCSSLRSIPSVSGFCLSERKHWARFQTDTVSVNRRGLGDETIPLVLDGHVWTFLRNMCRICRPQVEWYFKNSCTCFDAPYASWQELEMMRCSKSWLFNLTYEKRHSESKHAAGRHKGIF